MSPEGVLRPPHTRLQIQKWKKKAKQFVDFFLIIIPESEIIKIVLINVKDVLMSYFYLMQCMNPPRQL